MSDNKPDSVRVMAKPGADIAKLSVVVDGRVLMWVLSEAQVLKLIETAAESLGRMKHP